MSVSAKPFSGVKSTTWRVIFDPAGAGPWNMAVDEVLGESAAEREIATLRFYSWSLATLSLGYFQNYSERTAHVASHNCPAVRRASGGGAILHDQELTYSLALPCSERAVGDAEWLYLAVHGALVKALATWGVNAVIRCQARNSDVAKDETRELSCATEVPTPFQKTVQIQRENQSQDSPEPFLCFQRRAGGDVIVGSTKIAGSAQRRRRGAILQHGSVLLEQSRLAPELSGIFELTGVRISPDDLQKKWLAGLAKQLQFAGQPAKLSSAEVVRAKELATLKYDHSDWTNRR